jgi:hypothetical protein
MTTSFDRLSVAPPLSHVGGARDYQDDLYDESGVGGDGHEAAAGSSPAAGNKHRPHSRTTTWLLNVLWRKRGDGSGGCPLLLADTVTVDEGNLTNWYFTSSAGLVCRKHPENVASDLVRDRFIVREREKVLSGEPSQPICVVRYSKSGKVFTKVLGVSDFVDLMALHTLPENIITIQSYVDSKSSPPTLYLNERRLDERGTPIFKTRMMVHMAAVNVGDVEVEMRSVAKAINARFQAATEAILQHIELFAKHVVLLAEFKYLVDEQERVVFVGVSQLVTRRAEVVVPFHIRQAAKLKHIADERGRRIDPAAALEADDRAGVLLPLPKPTNIPSLVQLTSKESMEAKESHKLCHGDFCDLDLDRTVFRADGSIQQRRRVAALDRDGVQYHEILRKSIIRSRQDMASRKAGRIRKRLQEAKGDRLGREVREEALRGLAEFEALASANVALERPQHYYEPVKVCSTCYHVYLAMDENRGAAEDAAGVGSGVAIADPAGDAGPVFMIERGSPASASSPVIQRNFTSIHGSFSESVMPRSKSVSTFTHLKLLSSGSPSAMTSPELQRQRESLTQLQQPPGGQSQKEPDEGGSPQQLLPPLPQDDNSNNSSNNNNNKKEKIKRAASMNLAIAMIDDDGRSLAAPPTEDVNVLIRVHRRLSRLLAAEELPQNNNDPNSPSTPSTPPTPSSVSSSSSSSAASATPSVILSRAVASAAEVLSRLPANHPSRSILEGALDDLKASSTTTTTKDSNNNNNNNNNNNGAKRRASPQWGRPRTALPFSSLSSPPPRRPASVTPLAIPARPAQSPAQPPPLPLPPPFRMTLDPATHPFAQPVVAPHAKKVVGGSSKRHTGSALREEVGALLGVATPDLKLYSELASRAKPKVPLRSVSHLAPVHVKRAASAEPRLEGAGVKPLSSSSPTKHAASAMVSTVMTMVQQPPRQRSAASATAAAAPLPALPSWFGSPVAVPRSQQRYLLVPPPTDEPPTHTFLIAPDFCDTAESVVHGLRAVQETPGASVQLVALRYDAQPSQITAMSIGRQLTEVLVHLEAEGLISCQTQAVTVVGLGLGASGCLHAVATKPGLPLLAVLAVSAFASPPPETLSALSAISAACSDLRKAMPCPASGAAAVPAGPMLARLFPFYLHHQPPANLLAKTVQALCDGALATVDLLPHLKRIVVPVCFLSGAGDRLVPRHRAWGDLKDAYRGKTAKDVEDLQESEGGALFLDIEHQVERADIVQAMQSLL